MLDQIFSHLKRDRTALTGLFFVCLLTLTAIFAPWLAPQDPYAQNLENNLAGPDSEHWFGTDRFGRDILSRVIYGARISLTIAVLSQSLALMIGLLVGTTAGYIGGKVDTILMRVVDVMFAFPDLLLAIAIMAAIGPGFANVFIAIALVGWASIARLVRGQVLSVREADYIQAGRALGLPGWRLIGRHILPNCISPVIVAVTLGMAGAIMSEAALSFLGLGVQPPTPSWGAMISLGRSYIRTAPWLTIFPGLAIALAVLGFNLLGDGLQEALNPQLRLHRKKGSLN